MTEGTLLYHTAPSTTRTHTLTLTHTHHRGMYLDK